MLCWCSLLAVSYRYDATATMARSLRFCIKVRGNRSLQSQPHWTDFGLYVITFLFNTGNELRAAVNGTPGLNRKSAASDQIDTLPF